MILLLFQGLGNISKFFLDRVPKSSHNIHCLDCQPVADTVVAGQKTILILVSQVGLTHSNLTAKHFFFFMAYFSI